MMQYAHPLLANCGGLTFYRLLGSGRGLGFNPLPDWSVYSLLQVWEEEEAAQHFFDRSELMQKYRQHVTESWTLYMRNVSAHGKWAGSNPFKPAHLPDTGDRPIAVITRANIRPNKMYQFWKFVPTSERPLRESPGLLYTKGIGEVPLFQMATFSLWKDFESLKVFAYESSEHREAIKKTRVLNWYSEELFSRFVPYRSIGSWADVVPSSEWLGDNGHKTE